MNPELTNNAEPNYDELLSDLDLSPRLSLCKTLDKQVGSITDKLKKLGYSKDFVVKVAVEAMRRYDAAMEEFLKTTRTEPGDE